MKDLALILVMLGVFAFGYLVIANVDHLIEENQRLIADENRKSQSKIRIAAESPMLLASISAALGSCSRADPHIGFFLSSGRSKRLLKKLQEEQLDIVLLTDECAAQLDEHCCDLRIPYEKDASAISVCGLPVRDLEDDARIHVVWKKDLISKDRDRVIFALENEPRGLTHGRSGCPY